MAESTLWSSMDCRGDHEKIYALIVPPTNPPQYPWVCRKCGVEGRDYGKCCGTSDYETARRKFAAHETQPSVEKREEKA